MTATHYPALVEQLLKPQAYPGGGAAIELIETHISYLFLTGRYVYKVKKPVDYGFLDFTTLEKRRYFCLQEVELNRRMSREVYLGVVEIRQQDGRYAVEGPGRTVEYAVQMLQLPRDRAMNLLLGQGRVSEGDIRRLAIKIAEFHDRAETSPEITRLGSIEAVGQNLEENFSQTERFVGECLSSHWFDDLVAYSRAFLEAKEQVFRRRAAEGRVRDCHGDLHTAQIFLGTGPEGAETDGISIIDCIEFNDRFRCSDVAEDIAFLAMDLDFHRRPDLSRLFVETYVEKSDDPGALDLLNFFKAYRAYVRGKVTGFRLDDPLLSEKDREQVLATAQAYFRLAHSYTQVFPSPALIVVAGLTGTGKSTVAQDLAERWDLPYISSDITRKALAEVGPGEHRYESFGQGIYSPDYSRRTYDLMFQQAEEHLRAGRSVVLDGSFRRAEERREAAALGEGQGVDVWIVECCLPEDEVRRRLEHRLQEGTSVSDGRWELYHLQLREWEPVAEVHPSRYIRLDTAGSPLETIRRLLQNLFAGTL